MSHSHFNICVLKFSDSPSQCVLLAVFLGYMCLFCMSDAMLTAAAQIAAAAAALGSVKSLGVIKVWE
jgi:hypothetical protein